MHHLVQAKRAEVPELLRPYVPVESHIDAVIKDLTAKLVTNGNWTKEEQRDFNQLTLDRARWMMPIPFHRRSQ